MHRGAIQPGFHVGGEMRFDFYGDQIEVKFESWVSDPWNSWLRLRYSMTEYWTGEEIEIDDQIYLAATRPHFGGLRWWFVCHPPLTLHEPYERVRAKEQAASAHERDPR
jgi:hypothetical protein